jgi:hypothetical protein
MVLTHLYSIKEKQLRHRQIYFALDLLSSILAYTIHGKYGFFILVHAVIHMFAELQLLFPYSNFWKNIFTLAECESEKKLTKEISRQHRILYFIGTSEDIVTHALNVLALTNLVFL